MTKFSNNTSFNSEFDKVENAIFYPYVGKTFEEAKKKVMVFAYNIPVTEEKYEKEKYKRENPTHFADALNEYTYKKAFWTTTWRNFLKGTLGLKSNFTKNSETAVTDKIDSFVESIAHINFINDLVISETNNNAPVPKDLIEKSIQINKEYLEILKISHCIVWGKPVFNLMKKLPNFKVLKKEKVEKKGFELMYLENELSGQQIKVLKIFHPSMPGFGVYSEKTHDIMHDFLNE